MSPITKTESLLSASGHREQEGRHWLKRRAQGIEKLCKIKNLLLPLTTTNGVPRLTLGKECRWGGQVCSWRRAGEKESRYLETSKHLKLSGGSVHGPLLYVWHKDRHRRETPGNDPSPLPHTRVGIIWPKLNRSLYLSLIFTMGQ